MEYLLDLYAQPADPDYPVVCFDELPCGLVADVWEPRPATPGRPRTVDYEYTRHGSANVLLAFEAHRGWRYARVTAQRTKADFARFLQTLADEHYPHAQRIRLVLDNLNTHGAWALYDTFAPAEALRLTKRFEFIYTPVHGSWLNQSEIEFSALMRQCLRRRLGSREDMAREVAAWVEQRNRARATVDWRFRPEDARVTLARLYDSSLS